jgi:glycosyltransferase involved in cell wall biosynthesis
MARRLARTVAAKVPGSRRAMLRVDQLRKSKPLSASGLFDVEWYSLQAGSTFSDVDSCVHHYLAGGWRRGWSPNPLFEPGFFGRSGWNKSATDPVWEMLRDRTRRPTHPLFDPARYLKAVPAAAEHPGHALGHFLEHATDQTALPVDASLRAAEPLLWGDVRPRLLAAGRRFAHDQHLGRKRMTRSWDAKAESALIADALALPLPAGEGAGTPLVSIVMPVRNRSEQVPLAIRSVQAQTFAGWELVVVDDGSTDDTRAVLAGLAAADARITVLERDALGVSTARNEGIEETRGRYVAFLDSDNEWTEHFLDVSLRLMAARNLRAAYCALNGRRDGHDWYRAFDGGLEDLLVHNHIDLNALVVERSLLIETGGFDATLRRSVDWDLAIKIAKLSRPGYLPFIGVHYDDDRETADRITTRELASWGDRVLDAHIVDWPRLQALERVAGRVSVVMPTYDDWRMTVRAVAAVLVEAAAGDSDVEVVVVDNGSSRLVWATLQACFGGHPRVTLVRNVRNLNFALGSNTGVAASTGSTVLFLNNDTEVQPGWLAPLTDALDDPDVLAAQPLLLFPDGTVQCAGVVFPGLDGLPVHLLAHHPAEDAARVGTFETSALTGAALALRADDVLDLKGFDPLYQNGWEDIDLCLRLAQLRSGRFVVPTASVVTHHESKTPGRGKHIAQNRQTFMARWRGLLPGEDRQSWAKAGFAVMHYLPDASSDHEVPRVARPVLQRLPSGGADGAPGLRWAIKIGAHAGRRGDSWGDVHFARALADALRRLGQEVVVDRRDAHQRVSMYLDDVVVNLRGLDDFTIQPGRVNLMWVISHPELVSVDEVRRYHRVFAASEGWSRRMSEQAGVAVEPLLQATDPLLFNPDRAVPGAGHAVLFVGSSRGVRRPVIDDAVAAGLDVSIYGPLWDGLVDPSAVKGMSYPNDELGAAYRAAGVVLNDHWADMAHEGFVSNRLFDAVAAGARVISDQVDGIDELFGSAVQTYSDPDELIALAAAGAAAFPDDDALTEGARRVGREHSFDARAAVLLEHVLALVGKR